MESAADVIKCLYDWVPMMAREDPPVYANKDPPVPLCLICYLQIRNSSTSY
jgi:hypothetical protein